MPTKGADEYAVAELKNDVMCSGFTEVLTRSDNEPAIWALKESAATALKLAGATVKTEEIAKQRIGGKRCERCKGCREKEFGLSPQTLWTRVPSRTPVLSWLLKYSVAMVNRCRRGPDGKTAYELRKGRKFARALPHFAEKVSRKVWRESNQDGRTESSLVCLTGAASSTWAQRAACTRFEQSDVARPQNELTSRS